MPFREITQSVPAYAPQRESEPAASAWSDPRRIARVASVIPGVAGLLVLLGWATGVPVLRVLGPANWAAMNPGTALCLVLVGGSLWSLSQTRHPRATDVARGLAVMVLLVGGTRLVNLAFDAFPALDAFLFSDAMRSTGDGRTNRMAANSALNLVLTGATLLLLTVRWRTSRTLAQVFGVVVLFTALAALTGHVLRSGWFESIGVLNRMALPSAIAFAAIGLGLFAMSSSDGLAAVILSNGTGGAIARRLLPAALLVPPALGLVVIVGRRHGIVDADLGDTLLVLATMVAFVWMVARNVHRIHEAEGKRQMAEARLREKESLYRLIAENASDVVSLMDCDGRITYVSPSCERVLGFLPDEMLRMAPFAIVHPDDADRLRRHFNQLVCGEPVTSIECRVLHKTGRHLWLEMNWRGITNEVGVVEQLQVSSRDVTDKRENVQRLEEKERELQAHKRELEQKNRQLKALADTDALTGLKNRRAFEDRLEQELARARRHGHPLSLVLLDIDHFKSYNDSYGHPKGDDVLRQVGRLLSRMMRDTDFAARYGGEEFAILLSQTDRGGAKQVAERLRKGIEDAAWEERPITASLGVASLAAGMDTVPELIEHADRALYRSKEAGRNRVSVANPVAPVGKN